MRVNKSVEKRFDSQKSMGGACLVMFRLLKIKTFGLLCYKFRGETHENGIKIMKK